MAPISALQHQIPSGFPWGMPPNFVPEGYTLVVEVRVAQPVMHVPSPVVASAPSDFTEINMGMRLEEGVC